MFRKGISDFIVAAPVLIIIVVIFAIFSTIDIKSEVNYEGKSQVVESLDLTLISLLRSPVGDTTLTWILIDNFYEGNYDEFNEIIKEDLDRIYENSECVWELAVLQDRQLRNKITNKEKSLRETSFVLEQTVGVTYIKIPVFGKPEENLELGFKETC